MSGKAVIFSTNCKNRANFHFIDYHLLRPLLFYLQLCSMFLIYNPQFYYSRNLQKNVHPTYQFWFWRIYFITLRIIKYRNKLKKVVKFECKFDFYFAIVNYTLANVNLGTQITIEPISEDLRHNLNNLKTISPFESYLKLKI